LFNTWGWFKSKGLNTPWLLINPSCTMTFCAGRKLAVFRSKPVRGATAAKSLSNTKVKGRLKSLMQLDCPLGLLSLRSIGVMGPNDPFSNAVVFKEGRLKANALTNWLLCKKLVQVGIMIPPLNSRVFEENKRFCALAGISTDKQTTTAKANLL